MSPLGTTAALKARHLALDAAGQMKVKVKQGRPVFGVEMKVVDDVGQPQPHDGQSMGELLVRGPWVVNGYSTMPRRAQRRWPRKAGSAPAMSQRSTPTVTCDHGPAEGRHQIRWRMDQLDRP